jgi:hypothetical protein
MDVWFTRYHDALWCSVAKRNEPPTRTPFLVRLGVEQTLRRIQDQGYKIDQVGICPPDMLGLE